jgi:APA family basic amino acid/polyamine antiporter
VNRPLDRRLGLVGASAVGVGAMVGAGLFVVMGPAVEAAGDGRGLLLALALAALVAAGNALSSARLARLYPVAGGTYVYGRERLGPAWGHLAGWAFVAGKTSSCAAMALAVGAYTWPEHQRVAALATLMLVTGVNLLGVQKSAAAGVAIVAVVLVVVAVVVVSLWLAPSAPSAGRPSGPVGAAGVTQAAGLLFFAFAGYARLATLGEEVRAPTRTIPRAIALAFVLVLTVYAVSAGALLHSLGASDLAGSGRPFVTALQTARLDGLVPVVVAAGALAALGALLSLVLGVSRTVLAMARDGHLPRLLADVDARRSVPRHAEVAVASVVGVVVVLGDVDTSVAFSSFCVLTYYAVANASALTLRSPGRRSDVIGRIAALLSLLGCVVLAVLLPPDAVVAGTVVLAAGVVSFAVGRRTGRDARVTPGA